MKTNVNLVSTVLFWSACFYATTSYADCFQELAERAENGLIKGISEETSYQESFPILLNEIESCTGSSGTDLYKKILENRTKLEFKEAGSEWEKRITFILALQYPIDVKDLVKIAVLKWYNAEGKIKTFHFNQFSGIDILRDDMYSLYKDFSIHKLLH